MNGSRQIWLVALREIRERSRSRAYRASLVVMVLVVVGAIVLPTLLDNRNDVRRVGLSGEFSTELGTTIEAQGDAGDIETDIHEYATIPSGREAVRDGDIHVLVIDGRQLEWQRRIDPELRATTVAAIQSLAIRERAERAGIDPDQLRSLITPVTITDVELGQVAGRDPDDETATFIMTVLLFFALSTYGTMVLSGVVEEKSTRVVEVLLARIPARNLLAGKITGIGLLGFGQFALTALAAGLAILFVDRFDVPAISGTVLGWLVVWFVLGYAFYATVFGAMGSLASRVEDTQTVAGPITALLILVYFVSFATIGSPDTTWAQLVSFFPATAPLAMPVRMAMSDPAWWEPVLAAVLTTGATVGLVRLGGRIYTNAILHSGPTLKLTEALRYSERNFSRSGGAEEQSDDSPSGGRSGMQTDQKGQRFALTVAIVIGAVVGITAAVLLEDMILGVAVGAALIAISTRIIKIWSPPSGQTSQR